MIKNTRRINNLPSHISIVKVTDEEGFGGESVWLNINICPSNFVDEGGFSNVRVTANEKGTGCRVDSGETRDVLPDLFEVGKGILLSANDRSHTVFFI